MLILNGVTNKPPPPHSVWFVIVIPQCLCRFNFVAFAKLEVLLVMAVNIVSEVLLTSVW
jgi:hypothetical protein